MSDNEIAKLNELRQRLDELQMVKAQPAGALRHHEPYVIDALITILECMIEDRMRMVVTRPSLAAQQRMAEAAT